MSSFNCTKRNFFFHEDVASSSYPSYHNNSYTKQKTENVENGSSHKLQFPTNSLIPLLIQNSLQNSDNNQSHIFPNYCQKTLSNLNELVLLNQQHLKTTLANMIVVNQQHKEVNNNLTKNQSTQQHFQNISKTKDCANSESNSPQSKLAKFLILNNYSRALSNQMLLLNKFQQSTSSISPIKTCDFSNKEIGIFFDEINNIDNQNNSDVSNSLNNEDYSSETFSEKSDEIEHEDKDSSLDFLQLLQQQLKNKFLNGTLDFPFTTSNSAGFTISEILNAVDNKESLINNK